VQFICPEPDGCRNQNTKLMKDSNLNAMESRTMGLSIIEISNNQETK
jgi:hypothetical protein